MPHLADELASSFTTHAAGPAVVTRDECVSYAELESRAAGVAGQLAGLGVGRGDRVAVGLANSVDLVAAIVGTLRRGAVVVPLNPLYTAEEVSYVVDDSGAAAAAVHAEHRRALEATGTRDIAFFEPGEGAIDPRATSSVTEDAPALIVYTSGTTGRPKGVVLSQRALATNLRTVADAWGWTSADRLLLTLPCFHLHGLGLGILTSLLVGSTILLRERFAVDEILGDLAASAATMFFGVPTMYSRIVALPDDRGRGVDLSRMRLWVSGSAPLSAATFTRFRDRFGAEILERYGMTECGFALSSTLDGPRRAGAVGRVLPGVDCRLVAPEAADRGEIAPVPPGEQGEILIRGPGLFSGYWRRPEATTAAMLAGWLRSGDLAYVDEEGLYRIVGRSSVDIIKTRGFKVGAGEIEDVLLRHAAVSEAAVVGVPDADQGQRVVAAVTLAVTGSVTEAELLAHARKHLAPHKVPTALVVVEQLPKTGPGKYKKIELVRLLASRLP